MSFRVGDLIVLSDNARSWQVSSVHLGGEHTESTIGVTCYDGIESPCIYGTIEDEMHVPEDILVGMVDSGVALHYRAVEEESLSEEKILRKKLQNEVEERRAVLECIRGELGPVFGKLVGNRVLLEDGIIDAIRRLRLERRSLLDLAAKCSAKLGTALPGWYISDYWDSPDEPVQTVNLTKE